MLCIGLAGLAVAALSACGGGDGGSPAGSVRVEAGRAACAPFACDEDSYDGGRGEGDRGFIISRRFGVLRNVTVLLRRPDGGRLGRAATVDNAVSVLPGAETGPLIVEVADDGSGRGAYYDAAAARWVSLGSRR